MLFRSKFIHSSHRNIPRPVSLEMSMLILTLQVPHGGLPPSYVHFGSVASPRTLPSGQQPRLKEYWHSFPSATEGTDEKHERDKSRETREMERVANGICDQRVRKISYAEI